MKASTFILGISIALLLLVGFYIFSYLTQDRAQDSKEIVPSNLKTLVVEGREFSYTPEKIKISSGEAVRIVFKNKGSLIHDLTLEGVGKTEVIPPGEESSILLKDLAPGTYKIFCSVGNHAQLGMVATLEVI